MERTRQLIAGGQRRQQTFYTLKIILFGTMVERKEILEKLKQSTIDQNEEGLRKTVQDALNAGMSPSEAIREGLQPGLKVLGDKFDRGEIFLPDLVIAADVMYAALDILLKNIPEEERMGHRKGTVVIGTIYGDIHDIGKNIVAAFLRIQGYDVHDLGSDVPVKDFIQKAQEVNADIIAASSLLSSSMVYQRDLVCEVEDRGMRDKFVVIGGASTNPEWAKEINAHGYGRTVDDAIKLCDVLMETRGEVERPLIEE